MMSLLKRQCGPCKACCNAVGVEELGKPYWTDCQHQIENGCGCHGKHPPSCKHYQCLWLCGNMDFSDRPDQLGAIFQAENDVGGIWITVLILRGDVNFDRIERMAKIMQGDPVIKGVRFAKVDQVFNTGYPINTAKYPNTPNIGEGTTWAQYKHSTFWFLDAPKRIPLKVIT